MKLKFTGYDSLANTLTASVDNATVTVKADKVFSADITENDNTAAISVDDGQITYRVNKKTYKTVKGFSTALAKIGFTYDTFINVSNILFNKLFEISDKYKIAVCDLKAEYTENEYAINETLGNRLEHLENLKSYIYFNYGKADFDDDTLDEYGGDYDYALETLQSEIDEVQAEIDALTERNEEIDESISELSETVLADEETKNQRPLLSKKHRNRTP